MAAVRWTGSNADEVAAFAGGNFRLTAAEPAGEDMGCTAEVWNEPYSAWMYVWDGQWIIRGIAGDFCPCDEAVFELSYKPARRARALAAVWRWLLEQLGRLCRPRDAGTELEEPEGPAVDVQDPEPGAEPAPEPVAAAAPQDAPAGPGPLEQAAAPDGAAAPGPAEDRVAPALDAVPGVPAAGTADSPAAGEPAGDWPPAITAYHHPRFLSAEPTDYGATRFTFRPFTGTESEPEVPHESYRDIRMSSADHDALYAEYRAARDLWGQTRFRRRARPLLSAAAPVWEEYARAGAAMDQAFAEFSHTEARHWRAQILKLATAQAAALVAAQKWDERAGQLAMLEHEHWREVTDEQELRLRDVAADAGIDIKAWDIDFYDAYQRPSYHYGEFLRPLAAKVRTETERQNCELQHVDQLATLPGTE